MKSALFLGAGASAFVSQPTTRELLDRVRAQVQNTDMSDLLQQFIMNLLSNPQFQDVEELYDCIDQAIDTESNYNRAIVGNMQYAFQNSHIDYPTIVEHLRRLKSSIRDILLNSFTILPESHDMIKRVYDGIWSVMKDSGSDEFRIITTNYDLVIERYCHKAKWDPVNGFTRDQITLKGYWTDNWNPSSGDPLYLVKLHGSVNWHKEGNTDDVVELGEPGMRTAENDIMILPTTGPKEYDRRPFNMLISRFTEMIKDVDVLIVVGFSYRDPEINEVIRRHLSEGMIVVSVSPTPDDIRRIFTAEPKITDMNIQNLPFKFAEPGVFAYVREFNQDTIDDICDALSAVYRRHRRTGGRGGRLA